MAHVLTERKQCVVEGQVPCSRAGLRRWLRDLRVGAKRVAFEAGNQMKWVAETLKRIPDVAVHVVHPNEVKWIPQSGGKTDRVDAKKLAQLARAGMLPRQVHVVEGLTRELRELASARHQLQAKRGALINTIRGYVYQEGYRLPEKFLAGAMWVAKLRQLAVSAPLHLIIETCRVSIEALRTAERPLTERMLTINDPRCALLETIPAIGPLTARVLVGALDQADRFDDKKAVANYGALPPTLYQRGGVRQLGRINRDGRLEVRRALLQCAPSMARIKKTHGAPPLQQLYTRGARRRGKKVAIVALARKLLTTTSGVLKSAQARPRPAAAGVGVARLGSRRVVERLVRTDGPSKDGEPAESLRRVPRLGDGAAVFEPECWASEPEWEGNWSICFHAGRRVPC